MTRLHRMTRPHRMTHPHRTTRPHRMTRLHRMTHRHRMTGRHARTWLALLPLLACAAACSTELEPVTSLDGGGGCLPATCEALGATCGRAGDGCGGVLSCGEGCPAGESCGGGGTPNVCGSGACTPATCAALGAECGVASDGCGDVLACGACAEGSACGAALRCEGPRPDGGPGGGSDIGCRRAADCPGALCDYATGACVPATPERCGLPAAASPGPRAEGENCLFGVDRPEDTNCGAGLVCVPTETYYDEDTGEYGPAPWLPGQPLTAACRLPCDPCAGGCAGETECIALPGGGGFCAPGGLLGEGEACGDALGVIGECASGACSPVTFGSGVPRRVCLDPCRPDDRAYGRDSSFASASHSADCDAGEVCATILQSAWGDRFACVAGAFVPAGTHCEGERVCRFPDQCRNTGLGTGGGVLAVPGVCSPDGPCPAGTTQREIVYIHTGVSTTVCVAPRALPRLAACAADEDCQSGLSCAPLRGAGEIRVCQ